MVLFEFGVFGGECCIVCSFTGLAYLEFYIAVKAYVYQFSKIACHFWDGVVKPA